MTTCCSASRITTPGTTRVATRPFQNAVSVASGTSLALDGDLLIEGGSASEVSNTELAVRKLRGRLELSDGEIPRRSGEGHPRGFREDPPLHRMFRTRGQEAGATLPRAMLPRIRLQSPKITRNLTTEWFAKRVNDRYQRCPRGLLTRSLSRRLARARAFAAQLPQLRSALDALARPMLLTRQRLSALSLNYS